MYIKPITLLVGDNATGKTTYLQQVCCNFNDLLRNESLTDWRREYNKVRGNNRDTFVFWLERCWGINTRLGDNTNIDKIKLNGQWLMPDSIGFGWNRTMLLLIKLWDAMYFGRHQGLLGIENLERGLHPRSQGWLLDGLINWRKLESNCRKMPNIVIETHSKVIINRLGQLIEKKVINSNDVSLCLFTRNPDASSHNPIIKQVAFDSQGYLGDDWVIGFMDADVDSTVN